MKWVYNDGGRFAAGYQYHVNDCVCRALSIVTERPYREVQRTLKTLDAVNPRGRGGYPQYLTSLGFEWFPCTDIVHFSADELPQGRIVVQIKGVRPSNPRSMASPDSAVFSFGPAKRWE